MVEAGNRRWTTEMKVGTGDCASLTEKLMTCSVQDCKNVLLFGDFGAAAKTDLVAAEKDAMSVSEEECNRAAVMNGLGKTGDGELGELRSGSAEDVSEGLKGVVTFCGREDWLEGG